LSIPSTNDEKSVSPPMPAIMFDSYIHLESTGQPIYSRSSLVSNIVTWSLNTSPQAHPCLELNTGIHQHFMHFHDLISW